MDQITNLLSITLGAILVNNFIFSQFLGCCPFLGVSKKVDTAVGMGIAVTFVMGLASAVCYVVDEFVLGRFGLGTAAGIRILPEAFPALGMILPVGGFLTLACLIAAMQYILNKPKKDKKTEEVAK